MNRVNRLAEVVSCIAVLCAIASVPANVDAQPVQQSCSDHVTWNRTPAYGSYSCRGSTSCASKPRPCPRPT